MNPLQGVNTMASMPAIRIAPGDIPAPHGVADIVLFGGHLDGFVITGVEVPGAWPVVKTMERWTRKSKDDGLDWAFFPRAYGICLCEGGVFLDKRRHVRYCLADELA